MKSIFTVFTILSLCCLVSSSAIAVVKADHAIKGIIKELDGANITITKTGDHTVVFKTNEETKYDIDGNESALTEIKSGMYILVENNKDVAVHVLDSETNKRIGSARKK